MDLNRVHVWLSLQIPKEEMASARLGLGETMNEVLINKACKMAMKAHKSPEKPYLVKKSRRLSNVIFFSFPGCWSVHDWFTRNPFGEKKIDLAQFPSLKRIVTEEAATFNEAFLYRFQAIFPLLQHEVEKLVPERKQIVFTGHSSGGPIAILVTVGFLQEQYKKTDPNKKNSPLCVTFGSPLVGDHIFNHALKRENWSQYFTHFVMRHDIVPRVLLAPFSSIERELISLLHFLNPRFTTLMHEPFAEALYLTVMRNVSSLANHAACHLMGNINKLSETISKFIELSPYKPSGTYVFCTGNEELVVVKNPDAVLQILFYSSQLCSEQEGSEIAIRSIKDHHSYQSELQRLDNKNATYLDSLEMLPLNPNGGDVRNLTVDTFLSNLGLSTRARLCICAAIEFEKQKLANQEKFDAKKMGIETALRMLEVYKTRCEARKVSYYDALKISKDHDDFKANVKRHELAGIFDEIIEMIKKNELPDAFESHKDWIDIGTRYRRIVEPLDIANYYRHLKNEDTGPYVTKGRPTRYRFLQKLYEYAGRKETGSSFESCFWAEVEELDLCLRTSNLGLSEDVNNRILSLEKSVATWISSEVIGHDIFFEESTFVKWWKRLPQQHRLASCISGFINK